MIYYDYDYIVLVPVPTILMLILVSGFMFWLAWFLFGSSHQKVIASLRGVFTIWLWIRGHI
jgi:hypothetical protein